MEEDMEVLKLDEVLRKAQGKVFTQGANDLTFVTIYLSRQAHDAIGEALGMLHGGYTLYGCCVVKDEELDMNEVRVISYGRSC